MENADDISLCKLILAGNDEAFARLVERYSGFVFHTVVRITDRYEVAEELTQDVFLKVYKGLHRYKGDCRFSTWLYRIAYNTAISEARKRTNETTTIDETRLADLSEEEVDEALDRTDNSDRLEELERAIARLNPDEKAIIDLFYIENRSIEEVAGLTGLTEANVKVKLHRSRKKLYLWMTQKNENERR